MTTLFDLRTIWRRRLSFVPYVFILTLTGALILPETRGTAQISSLAELSVRQASKVYGIPSSQLSLVGEAWLAHSVYRAKVLDNESGDIHIVSLRMSGEVIDEEEVQRLLEAERVKHFVGKIEARLKLKAVADPGGVSSVIVWVKTPDIPRDAWHAAIEDGRRDQVFSEAKRLYAKAEIPVLQFLADRSISVRYASPITPIIEATVPNNLLPALESVPQVAWIYLETTPKPSLDVAIPTVRADEVWATGTTGTAVKVAIVESGFLPNESNPLDFYSALPSNSPNLGAVVNFETQSPRPSFHAAYVMGAIASTHLTYKGIAFGVERPIYCGNAKDTFAPNQGPGVIAATDWAVGTIGANAVNQSWGDHLSQIGPFAIHDDYLIRTYLTTITCSVGNDPSQFVEDPSNGYNMIAVGAFFAECNKKWSNDIMAGFSSFIDPISPHNDREKPEVVAPGKMYSTTEAPPWIHTPPPGTSCPTFAFAGTSYAAPLVTGAAALLMQAKPALKTRPDEVKAILMASAIHNIEGSSRLSELDGAGGIQVKAAFDAVMNGWSSRTAQSASPPSVTFNVTAGKVVRFVISWLSFADGSGTDVITDYDLTLKNPSGSVVATSVSFDNNYEIVEFTAGTSGNYTAWISRRGFIPGPYPPMAWSYYLQ